MSLELHVPDAVDVDALMKERGERFIAKTLVKISTAAGKVIVRTLLLTHRTLYEFSIDPLIAAQILGLAQPGMAASPAAAADAASSLLTLPPLVSLQAPRKEKAITDLHSLSSSPFSPHSFTLHFFSGSIGHRAALGFTKLKKLLSVRSSFSSFLKSKQLTFASPFLCQQFYFLLSRLMTHQFQQLMEATVLPAPEYYARHAFVLKGSKDRLLLLSNAFLYNIQVSYRPTAVRGIKWAIHIQAVSSLSLSSSRAAVQQEEEKEEAEAEGGLNELRIAFDVERAQRLFDNHHRSYKSGGELHAKDWRFVFRCSDERQRFVRSMQKVFYEQTAQQLRVQQEQ